MSKKLKTTLKLSIGLIVVLLLMHLAIRYLIPFVIAMHSGGAY